MKALLPLLKLRSVISSDGRIAQFFLLFKGGQNAAFTIPFAKIGLLIRAMKGVASTMRSRLFVNENAASSEIRDGLSEALVIQAVAVSFNPETGERLLWIETADSGAFSFRLNERASHTLIEAFAEAGSQSNDNESVGTPDRRAS